MSSPITSADFSNSATSQSLCDAFRDKLLNNGKMGELLAYLFDSNGDINPGGSDSSVTLSEASTSLGADLVSQILQSLCPIGTLIHSPGALSLSGTEWKSCDGSTTVLKTAFPLLWAAVSGWGLSETNGGLSFILPDLRDRFFLAAGETYSAGATGGAATIALVADEIPHLDLSVNNADRVGGSSTWSHFDAGGESATSDVAKPVYPAINAESAQTTLVATHDGGGVDGAATAHSNLPPYRVGAVYIRCGYRIGSTVLT